MRHIARVDANQSLIVEALRRAGASVLLLHQVGGGCPDILVGYQGRCYLAEVKRPGRQANLTPDEQRFFSTWRGQADIVTSPEDALRLIGAGE